MSQSNGFRGALSWSFLANGGKVVTNMVVLSVLSALLGPERMGIVVVANIFIFLIQQTVLQGAIPTLVQRDTLDDRHLHSAFWLIIGTAVGVAALSFLGAGVLTSGLSRIQSSRTWDAGALDQLENVLRVLSLSLIVRSTGLVPESLFRREMDFKTIGIRSNIAAVIAGVSAFVAAFSGAGIWALVIMQLVLVTVEAIGLWTATTYRPALSISREGLGDLLPFYWRNMIATFGEFLNSRVDTIVVATFFGPQVTGLYRIPSRLIETQMDVAARSLQGVALPELSRLQGDPVAFRQRLRELVTLSNRMVVPLMGVIAACAHGLLRSLDALSDALRSLATWLDFAEGEVPWSAGADALEVLCLVGAFQALYYMVAPTLQAYGRPTELAVLIWTGAVLSAGIFVTAGLVFNDASVADQVLAVAGARAVLFGVVLLILGQGMLWRVTGLSPADVIGDVKWLLLAGLAAYVARETVDLILDLGGMPALADLAISGVVAVGAGCAVLLGLDPDSRRTALKIRARLAGG